MSFPVPRGRFILAALFCIFTVVMTGRRHRMEPLPVCAECVPREDILTPGIGFDLADSYGTAAIRYNDKTIVNLGRV